jgi:hypothetical protein
MSDIPSTSLVELWTADGKTQLYWNVSVELEEDGGLPRILLYKGKTWERRQGYGHRGYWYSEAPS